ncbi:MAG: peptidyl-prolyl cis-trans isomerase [Nitrospirota bacterium]
MRKVLTSVIAAAVIGTLAPAAHAFPKEGMQGAGQEQKQQLTPEQIEQARKSREEARKIIVARVNGAAITMESLVKMMNRLGPASKDIESTKRDALDKLIFQELAFQKAKAEGITVEKEKIDAAVTNFRNNVGGDEEFKKALDAEGLTLEMLKAQIERSLMLEQIFGREVYSKVTIPEDKVKEEYEREKHRFIKPEKVAVVDVLVLQKEGTADAAKKAAELLEKIKADRNQDPWKLVLDGSFIVRHYQIRKDKDKELHEAAVKLKPGELSGVIKAPDGYHVLKLKEYSPERYYTFEESRGALEGKFRYEAQEQRVKEWLEELKKGAKLEIIESALATPSAEAKSSSAPSGGKDVPGKKQ